MSPVTRREFLAAAAAAATVHAAPAAGPRLTVAPFTEEVTPPIGHPCMGGGIAPVKEIVDPLFAKGFVLQGAGDPVVVVAVDWCEIRNDAYDRWRTPSPRRSARSGSGCSSAACTSTTPRSPT